MRLLFATDGEEAAAHASRLIARIGDRSRVDITVVSVNCFDIALKEASVTGHYSADAGRKHAEAAATAAAEVLSQEGFGVDAVVADGDATLEILRIADETGADIIAMGAGSTSWLGALILGSTSNSVLQEAPCSVMIVHSTDEGTGPGSALVAVDGSDHARRAAGTWAGFADPERCRAAVLAVTKPAGLPGYDAAHDEALAVAEEAAREVASDLQAARFAASARTAMGHPGAVLVDEMSSGDHDLVVAGSRGLGRFQAAVLGSVSNRLVRSTRAALIGR